MLLADLLGAAAWMDDANCRHLGPDMFFVDDLRPAPRAYAERRAVAICHACDVQVECLTYAMNLESGHTFDDTGIWGGLTAEQRRALRRNRRSA